MKNFGIILLTVFAFVFSNTVNAQQLASADVTEYTTTDNHEVEILTNFKATKNQKKVIKKVQKFVTPRLFDRNANVGALEGKTVKLQINFDQSGAVSNIAVVNGIAPQIDERVVSLVKEFDTTTPFASTNIERPTAIQLDVKLVAKEQYMK